MTAHTHSAHSQNRSTTFDADGLFRRSWEKALRFERRGLGEQAQRAWRGALRSSLKTGNDRNVKIALDGLKGGTGTSCFGPATTPKMSKRKASRHLDRVQLRSTGGSYDLSRFETENFLKSVKLDLVVDEVRQEIRTKDQRLGMEGREIPLKILTTLIESQGVAIGLPELFPKAWGRSYNAAYDANTVYFHVCRLRKVLEDALEGEDALVTGSGGYRLTGSLKCGIISKPKQSNASRGRSTLLKLVQEKGFITNRTYCEATNTSRSTALRELAELVNEGVLVRCGSGRGAHYRLAEDVEDTAMAA